MSHLLQAVTRTLSGVKTRVDGNLPAVVYGAGGKSESLSLVYTEFEKVLSEAGESSLIDLKIDGKEAGKVLIHDIQYDPVKGNIIHVDLLRIDMNKPLTTLVELHFVGEAPAVKELGGTLVRNVDEVEVKCLPKDLVSHIDVDLSILKTFDDVIKVKDLVLPKGIEIVNPHAEDVLATASPALTEEQIKAMEEESKNVDISKIEVSGKKKAEEENAEDDSDAGEKK